MLCVVIVNIGPYFMNKKFFLIYFLIAGLLSSTCLASVRLITEPAKPSEQRDLSGNIIITSSLPDPLNEEEVRNYFKKRFEIAAVSLLPNDANINESSSFDIIYTPEYYAAQKEKNKPLFQKMYEEALKTINSKENFAYGFLDENHDISEEENKAAQTATRFFNLAMSNKQSPQDISIPTVSFSLPSGKRALAPAIEHIPYMLSYIDIQANGYLKIEDTIIVVANNKKFTHAIHRAFPKYNYNKDRNQRMLLLMELLYLMWLKRLAII